MVGFDSAQPTFAPRALSEVEGRSLSEVEGRSLSEVEGRSLSEVEGHLHKIGSRRKKSH